MRNLHGSDVTQSDRAHGFRGKPLKRLTDVPGGCRQEHVFLLNCLLSFIDDANAQYGTIGIDLSKDKEVIINRFESQGFGFISKTLPKFSDWFRNCVTVGRLSRCSTFKNYRSSNHVFPYPAFLRGLVTRCFDGNTGALLPEPLTDDDRQLRRVCFTLLTTICNSFGKKYEVPLEDEKLDLQVRELIRFDSEDSFRATDVPLLSSHAVRVASQARKLLHSVLNESFDPWGRGLAHGSGAVSIKKEPHEKYTTFPGLPIALEKAFNSSPDLCSINRWFASCEPVDPSSLEAYSFENGGIARLEMVPKDSSKLRTICCEPTENMVGQQGLRMSLYDWIESHRLTKGYVNFTNQEINRELARNASASGCHATLDLSSASDSVTLWHVDMLWPSWIVNWFRTVRSRYTMAKVKQYQGGRSVGMVYVVWEPNMFAPMGSAICFPVEALTFWALVKAHIMETNRSLPAEAAPTRSDVWVYGDDIIIPVESYESTSLLLQEFKIKVNLKKSFAQGPFRESCGYDAFYGTDVSPVTRLQTRIPFSGLGYTKDEFSKSIVSWVEYANMFERGGYTSTSSRIRNMLAHQVPSSRSYPRLSEDIDRGFLYFLDRKGGLTYLQFVESSPTIEAEPSWPYKYGPCFPHDKWNDLPNEQGVLFTGADPYCYGYSRRLWVAQASPYDADLSSDLRYTRYMLERGKSGSPVDDWARYKPPLSEGLPGNWFPEKAGFHLSRKRVVLT